MLIWAAHGHEAQASHELRHADFGEEHAEVFESSSYGLHERRVSYADVQLCRRGAQSSATLPQRLVRSVVYPNVLDKQAIRIHEHLRSPVGIAAEAEHTRHILQEGVEASEVRMHHRCEAFKGLAEKLLLLPVGFRIDL